MEKIIQERKSNIDLLKIILAYMVIILHFNNENMGKAFLYTSGYNLFFLKYMESLSIIAVNCFILITGYLSVNTNNFKLKKIVNLYLPKIYYLVLIGFIYQLIQVSLYGISYINIF